MHPPDPTGLVLAPASPENLDATIRRQVPFSKLDGFLKPTAIDRLRASVVSDTGFHCWACTRSRQDIWRSLTKADCILFFETGTQVAWEAARPVGRIESAPLGAALWPAASKDPWELIFTVNEVESRRLRKPAVLGELGYSADFWLPGIIRVPRERLDRVKARWGSINGFLETIAT